MIHRYKWMIFCLVGALAITFFLPKLGMPIAGASLLVTVLMIGCCVFPMFFMMKADSGEGKEGSCCSKDKKKEQKAEGEVDKEKTSTKSCH